MNNSKSISHIVKEFVKKVTEFINDSSKEGEKKWDVDNIEEFLRSTIGELGKKIMKEMIQQKVRESEHEVKGCQCSDKLPGHRREQINIFTTFGMIELESTYHYCKNCHKGDNPIKRLSGIKGRWKSKLLQKAMVDFGSEESFRKGAERFKEHYGFEISPSSLRQVTEEHGASASEFVEEKLRDATERYINSGNNEVGVEKLIIQCDGSNVRTGRLREMSDEELKELKDDRTPKRRLKRRKRETRWRDVRLIAAKEPEEIESIYLAKMQSSENVGKDMFRIAALKGMGDATEVMGIGDGAPWIAQEFKNQFPNGWFLLDKYHLIEHITGAAEGLRTKSKKITERWIQTQIQNIESGLVQKVLKECDKKSKGKKQSPFFELKRYIEERIEYLDYKRAKEEGLPVGSGIVESGHKHVVQDRLKKPGTWWHEDNVNKMSALRTLRASRWWDEYWRNYV